MKEENLSNATFVVTVYEQHVALVHGRSKPHFTQLFIDNCVKKMQLKNTDCISS